MCPAYQVQIMFMKEFGDDFRAKGKAHASVVLTPSHGFFVRITPQQITEQTIVWYVCWPHYPADLLHGLQVWTQACNCNKK